MTRLFSVRYAAVLGGMLGICSCLLVGAVRAGEDEVASAEKTEIHTGGSPERGFQWLTEKAYLPADFDQETFDAVWRAWPKELRSRAESMSTEERRKIAFARYGLTERHEDPQHRPLQYVVDEQGQWTMNCFTCHGGDVYGQPWPGAPNSRFALETLTAEIRSTKLRTGAALTRLDVGSMVMPLGRTVGRTNAVMFGVGLMHFRRPDLSIDTDVPSPKMTHHDMDAPPWWHFHRRPHIYIDGFAERGHRGLMQFMLVRENGPEKFRQWEEDFRDVYAYLMSLRPPKYPKPIDDRLASIGRNVFGDHCARCHGTYGRESEYPSVTVPLDEIGTDPVRLSALPVAGREKYARELVRARRRTGRANDRDRSDWLCRSTTRWRVGESSLLSQRKCSHVVACSPS